MFNRLANDLNLKYNCIKTTTKQYFNTFKNCFCFFTFMTNVFDFEKKKMKDFQLRSQTTRCRIF